MVKDELHEQPDSSWILLRVEDLLSRGNESAWCSLLVEDDKGFLNVVEAGLLGPCLSIQALGDVQLGMVEMQDRTQEDASSDLVEEVLVLKYREPSGNFQHPRGLPELDQTDAVVCDHPCAVAASSHSAWLPTHAHPLLSVHNPDVRASNTVAASLAPRTPEAAAHAASQTAVVARL